MSNNIPMPKIKNENIHIITGIRGERMQPLLGSSDINHTILYQRIYIRENSNEDSIANGDVGYVLDKQEKPIIGSTFIVKHGKADFANKEWVGYVSLTSDQVIKSSKKVWITRRGRGEFDFRRPVQATLRKFQKASASVSSQVRITLNVGVWNGVNADWIVEEPRRPGDRVAITYPIEKLSMLETTFLSSMTLDQAKTMRNYTVRPRS